MAKKTKRPVTDRPRADRMESGTRERKRKRCVVCGAEVAPFSDESLCWVCRRLKISAWRDMDSQAMMQE